MGRRIACKEMDRGRYAGHTLTSVLPYSPIEFNPRDSESPDDLASTRYSCLSGLLFCRYVPLPALTQPIDIYFLKYKRTPAQLNLCL
jgi:hypothetical protein